MFNTKIFNEFRTRSCH